MLTSNPTIDARMLREKSGITLKEVAKHLDVNLATVYRWESGESPPMIPLGKVARLTELYDCSIQELAAAYGEARQKWLEKQLEKDNIEQSG